MALGCHPAVEMGKVVGLGLHPDEGRLGGVEGLLEGSIAVLGDVGVLGFFQEVGQRRAEAIKAVQVSRVPREQKIRH